MADITVNFMRPTDNRVVTVGIDDGITATQAIDELLANNFVTPGPGGYELSHNNEILLPDQTLADAGVQSGAKLIVNPTLVAGAADRS